jgi:hypothetical protein
MWEAGKGGLMRPYFYNKPGVAVVHACKPSLMGGRGRRITAQVWPSKMWRTVTEK